MTERLADYSCRLNREISVFLSRRGRVLDVSVGSNESVSLPSIRKRRGLLGLSGVRCVHTHPGGSPMLSSVDVGTLLSSRLDSMAALSVKNGRPGSLCAGFIGKELDQYEMYGPFRACLLYTSKSRPMSATLRLPFLLICTNGAGPTK